MPWALHRGPRGPPESLLLLNIDQVVVLDKSLVYLAAATPFVSVLTPRACQSKPLALHCHLLFALAL